MPDGFRVRTYFLSFARKYAEIGARYGAVAPVRTALNLLEVLLRERADDGAALQLRAELRAQIGDEQNALDASLELARLSLGMARRPSEPRTPQGDSAPWLLGTPGVRAGGSGMAATPTTAHSARGDRGSTSAQQPPPAPPWHTHTPRQPAAPSSMPRLSGFAPTAALGDCYAATPTQQLSGTPIQSFTGASARPSPRGSAQQPAGGLETPPPSLVRGVLGRRSGAGSSSRKSSMGGSVGGSAARPPPGGSAARTPASHRAAAGGQAPDLSHSSVPNPRAAQAANSVADRVQLQQEIRQWRRRLVRAQAAGARFADRSGPEADWVFNYLEIEAEEQQHARAVSTPVHGAA